MDQIFIPFIPSLPTQDVLPLSRFIPPYPAGVAVQWLQKYVPPGSWVIDPFGTNPLATLEIARAGFRILVSINNPVTSFILRILAGAPSISDFQSALSEFSKLRRGDERLENHLESLYHTQCAICSQTIPAQSFLWKRNETRPFSRLYRCPKCGDENERPMTSEDFERLTLPGSDRLQRSRAIELLKLKEDEELAGAVEALNTYNPRSLYFIMTFLSKLDNAPISGQNRQLLQALLLSACDEGNSLWGWPSGRSRPRQLQTPVQFRENNLWLSIENNIPSWCGQSNPIPLAEWPDIPPESGGITLYQGRLKNILPLPNEIKPEASFSIFPRPNQAFWTLSALWSGWLWGHESTAAMKSTFERRRYDWIWHVNALQSNLQIISRHFPPGFPLFCILPELEPGLLLSSIVASERANFILAGIALRPGQETAQLQWRVNQAAAAPPRNISKILSTIILEHFVHCGEPADYLSLLAACLGNLTSRFSLAAFPQETPEGIYKRIQSAVNIALTEQGFLRRYNNQSQDIESGLWWLDASQKVSSEFTLADRVERQVIAFLQENKSISFQALDQKLCECFPGLLTPSSDLVFACLESYSEPAGQSEWHLLASEELANRHNDLLSAKALLAKIGRNFGFTIQGDNPLLWINDAGETELFFYLSASCNIGQFLLTPSSPPPKRCILVLPGSRSKLLAYKLHRDPHLAEAAAQGWRFLKFRHLRQLAERSNMTHDLWNELLDKDPPLWEDAVQIAML
jgi:hypothetical protein